MVESVEQSSSAKSVEPRRRDNSQKIERRRRRQETKHG